MPHQKLLLIMIWIGLITTVTTLGWNFPLQEVANPACRGTKREDLSEKCKIDIIKGSHQTDTGKLLFSALWGTSYEQSQKANSGGHPSLDMPSSEGTPVYAIHDGIVKSAKERGGYGLSITIEHELDGKKIYSNYSHLAEMLVKPGEKVSGKTLIGKVGCTGFSISGDPTRCGNHLDFQITTDKSPSHPYGYGDCVDGYFGAVEKGTCKDKLLSYTIDPLVFFATYAPEIDINYPLIAPHILKKEASHSAPSEKEETQPLKTPTNPETQPKPSASMKDMIARIKAQNEAKPALPATQTVTHQVVAQPKPTTQTPHEVAETHGTAKLPFGTAKRSRNQDITAVSPYKIITLTLELTDNLGNVRKGTLPDSIRITTSNASAGSIFPEKVSMINTDKKYLFFQSRLPGTTTLTLWYGEKKIGEETIVVK